MNIGTLCSRHPITTSTGAPLSEVARLMREAHVGAVVVTEDGLDHPRVVGIITDRDIVRSQLGRTADHREAVEAFLAKRPAAFTGS